MRAVCKFIKKQANFKHMVWKKKVKFHRYSLTFQENKYVIKIPNCLSKFKPGTYEYLKWSFL